MEKKRPRLGCVNCQRQPGHGITQLTPSLIAYVCSEHVDRNHSEMLEKLDYTSPETFFFDAE